MRTDQKLLYFSLNKQSVDGFYNYLDSSGWDLKDSFRRALPREEAKSFHHPSDLIFFVDSQEHPESLYIIVDYISFYNVHPWEWESGDKEFTGPSINNEIFTVESAAKCVRRAILKYPETMFLFDESWLGKEANKNGDTEYGSFLFCDDDSNVANVHLSYHRFSVYDEDPFMAIRRDRSNLFDGSNLRFAIMRYLYDNLKVNRYNFSNIQNSRRDHLALVVEEELSQNRFNSYCLYVNGYRVVPISSSGDLEFFNNECVKKDKNHPAPVLIVRDFDLQFDDVSETTPKKLKVIKDNKTIEVLDIYKVDSIRRLKKGEYSHWYVLEQDREKACQSDITLSWEDGSGQYENGYWSNLRRINTLFITKGPVNIEVVNNGAFLDEINGSQIIPGLNKPVAGIYESFRALEDVRRVSLEALSLSPRATNDHEKSQVKGIDTTRQKHDHGVSLDIYDLVKAMVRRARHYQQVQEYTLSSIIAWDAIEVMNGFHEQLMLQAYHIAAISENAIAMNVLGGDDMQLKKDAEFRIKKITDDVDRLLSRSTTTNNQERLAFRHNFLNQIFSDCRDYCYNKEHFLSEDTFVSALGHLNEGVNLNWEEIKKWIRDRRAKVLSCFRNNTKSWAEADMEYFMKTVTELSHQLFAKSDCSADKFAKCESKYKKLVGYKWEVCTNIKDIINTHRDDSDNEWLSSDEGVIKLNKDGSIVSKNDGCAVVFFIHNGIIDCYPVNISCEKKNGES